MLGHMDVKKKKIGRPTHISGANHPNINVEFTDARQARAIYKFKNTKEKP